MALDLSGVRRIVEGLLDDELQLWRDADGDSGDELDEETGDLKPASEGSVPLWEGSGAVVRPGQLSVTPPLDGAVASLPAPTAYQGLLPLSAPQVMPPTDEQAADGAAFNPDTFPAALIAASSTDGMTEAEARELLDAWSAPDANALWETAWEVQQEARTGQADLGKG
ncbi:hypothetical protein SAURM35S_07358 [Streptomyces aurantiogriseus]